VTADESYIRESILNPQAKVVAGFQPIMPTFQGQVSEEQLLQLVTYIKSLSPNKTQGISTTSPARSNNPSTGPATPGATGAQDLDSQRSNPVGSTAPSNRTEGGQPGGQTGGQTNNSPRSEPSTRSAPRSGQSPRQSPR
jgi:hypothetical protein